MLLPPPPPACAQASEINKLVISEPIIVWKTAELCHNLRRQGRYSRRTPVKTSQSVSFRSQTSFPPSTVGKSASCATCTNAFRESRLSDLFDGHSFFCNSFFEFCALRVSFLSSTLGMMAVCRIKRFQIHKE